MTALILLFYNLRNVVNFETLVSIVCYSNKEKEYLTPFWGEGLFTNNMKDSFQGREAIGQEDVKTFFPELGFYQLYLVVFSLSLCSPPQHTPYFLLARV